MQYKTDEEILYSCFLKLGQDGKSKNNIVPASEDKTLIAGITSSVSLMITRLASDDIMLSTIDIQKYLQSSKGIYLQYLTIRRRNPGCISNSLISSMDNLVHAMSHHEAEMISTLRTQEKNGEYIDIQSIFDNKKNLKRLKETNARTIVADALKDPNMPVDFMPIYYMTASGKRFHHRDCPYCRNKMLEAATIEEIKERKLSPCKCLESLQSADGVDRTSVTAFVDESIHPVRWNEKGRKGKAGSFSYIICWGDLKDEGQISDKNLIAQGVDFISEHEKLERITESAVGKVLMTLAYDCEYIGHVHIYTDNISVADHWTDLAINSRLAKCFMSVKVSHITRDKNTRADKLGRTRMLLDMPMDTYKSMVKSDIKIKELEKKIRRLEEEKKTLTLAKSGTEESVLRGSRETMVETVAPQQSDTGASVRSFFTALFRSIRDRFMVPTVSEEALNN